MAEDVPRMKCLKEKHSADQALCFDRVFLEPPAGTARTQAFCKIFEIHPMVGDKRFARVFRPRASSDWPTDSCDRDPSRAFEVNPKLNCGFAVNAVIRIMRINYDMSAEFSTGWIASPPILTEGGSFMFFAVCAAHTFDNPDEGDRYKGCFGPVGSPKNFRLQGFSIEKDPLFCVKNGEADIAIVRVFVDASKMLDVIPRDATFLLPCSPSQFGTPGAHLATFGYNGFSWLLEQAKMELKNGRRSELQLWELYSDVFQSRDQLYRAIKDTVDKFDDGSLCCSPCLVVDLQADYATVRSSTLEGCSGAPLMPNEVEGVVCYVHRGREPSSRGYDLLNRATGLDLDSFVDFYAENILKYIPERMEGRDVRPFEAWCALHNLRKAV